MSRQRFTSSGSVSLRNRSIRSWVSTWVSACGWKTSLTPCSSKRNRASSSVPVTRFFHCSGSMSAPSRGLAGVLVGVLLGQVDEVLRADRGQQPGLLPELQLGLLQRVRALVQTGEDGAAADREAALRELLVELLGSWGMNPCGPSSV